MSYQRDRGYYPYEGSGPSPQLPPGRNKHWERTTQAVSRPSYGDDPGFDHRRSTAGPSRNAANVEIRDRQMSTGPNGSHQRDRRKSPPTDPRHAPAPNETLARGNPPRSARTEREGEKQSTEAPSSDGTTKSLQDAEQKAASDLTDALIAFEPARLEHQDARKKLDQNQNLRDARDRRGEKETPIQAEQYNSAKDRVQAAEIKVKDARNAILKAQQEVVCSILRSARAESRKQVDKFEKDIPSLQHIRKVAEGVGDSVRKDIVAKDEVERIVEKKMQSNTNAFLTMEQARTLMKEVADQALRGRGPPASAAGASAIAAASEAEEGEMASDDRPPVPNKPAIGKHVLAELDVRCDALRDELTDALSELSTDLADRITLAIEAAQDAHRARKRKAFENAPDQGDGRHSSASEAAQAAVAAVFGEVSPAVTSAGRHNDSERGAEANSGTALTAQASDRPIASLPGASVPRSADPSTTTTAQGQISTGTDSRLGGAAGSHREEMFALLAEERKRNDERFRNVGLVVGTMRHAHQAEVETLKTLHKNQQNEIEKLQAEIQRLTNSGLAGTAATPASQNPAQPALAQEAVQASQAHASTDANLQGRLEDVEKSLEQCSKDLASAQESCKLVPRLNSRLNKHKEMIDVLVDGSKNHHADLTYLTSLFAGIPEVSASGTLSVPNGNTAVASGVNGH